MREEKSSKLAKVKANLQKLMKKRWVLPAVYLGLAALVLSTFIYLQGTSNTAQDDTNVDPEVENPNSDIDVNSEDALPVTTVNEVFKMPVVNEKDVKVVGQFYDFEATEEEQQAALVFYDNTYFQNKGIDLATEAGEAFDVVAALSGTVVKAEKDALFGNVVHIEHDNNVLTVYQSLENLKVEEGQPVKQGDTIGQAGRNLYNKDAGVHVHFEIRHDGTPVNPKDVFNQSASSLKSQEAEEVTEGNEENADSTETEAKDEVETPETETPENEDAEKVEEPKEAVDDKNEEKDQKEQN